MGKRRARPELPPVLLGEVRAAGIEVEAYCALCMHRAVIPAEKLAAMPDDTVLDTLARRTRCTGCNRTGGHGVVPAPQAWIAYLRKTGQDHRLPYWACFTN